MNKTFKKALAAVITVASVVTGMATSVSAASNPKAVPAAPSKYQDILYQDGTFNRLDLDRDGDLTPVDSTILLRMEEAYREKSAEFKIYKEREYEYRAVFKKCGYPTNGMTPALTKACKNAGLPVLHLSGSNSAEVFDNVRRAIIMASVADSKGVIKTYAFVVSLISTTSMYFDTFVDSSLRSLSAEQIKNVNMAKRFGSSASCNSGSFELSKVSESSKSILQVFNWCTLYDYTPCEYHNDYKRYGTK